MAGRSLASEGRILARADAATDANAFRGSGASREALPTNFTSKASRLAPLPQPLPPAPRTPVRTPRTPRGRYFPLPFQTDRTGTLPATWKHLPARPCPMIRDTSAQDRPVVTPI